MMNAFNEQRQSISKRNGKFPIKLVKTRKNPLRSGNHRLERGFYGDYFVRGERGARYLDAKTSRWLSTDPALGDYIPGAPINDQVRKQNQNLPGIGGIYNYVNLHLYHYAGNNPIKYLDPDGRTPRSNKLSESRYMFSPDLSTGHGAIEAAFEGVFPIPFLGGPALNAINKAFGFQTIDTSSAYSTLSDVAGTLAEGVSLIADIAGNVSDVLKTAGKIAGNISMLLTAIDIGVELSKSDSVGMDQMMSKILGSDLSASSHEGVSALYTYAKSEMVKLRDQGSFSFTTDGTGMLTSYGYKDSDFDNLRQELRIIKSAMGE